MQINSTTNTFNINTQNRNCFSKNESHVAFGSREDVLDYASKIALKHIDEKNLYKAKVKKIIKDAIKNCDVEILFDAVGLKAKRDLFGKYTVSGYGKGGGATHDFSELGVDENKLFKKIKRIKGTADFRESKATDLGSLKRVDGDIWFSDDNLTPLISDYYIKHNGKIKYFSADLFDDSISGSSAISKSKPHDRSEFDITPCISGAYTTSNLDYPPRYHDRVWKPSSRDYRPFTAI